MHVRKFLMPMLNYLCTIFQLSREHHHISSAESDADTDMIRSINAARVFSINKLVTGRQFLDRSISHSCSSPHIEAYNYQSQLAIQDCHGKHSYGHLLRQSDFLANRIKNSGLHFLPSICQCLLPEFQCPIVRICTCLWSNLWTSFLSIPSIKLSDKSK